MATTTMDSGLGESVSSYQPNVLSSEQWARFSDDAQSLVLQLHNSTPHRAVQRLSHLSAFLADVADTEPNASLAQLLARDRVEGYLHRIAGQVSEPVRANRQAALNNFLQVAAGRTPRQPARRKRETHLAPYTEGELIRLIAAACADPAPEADVFARSIGCVLAGAELPATDDDTIEVHVAAGVIEVDEARWVAPLGMALPPGGVLNRADVEAGRAWAKSRLKASTDPRRLSLTALAVLAGSAPALTMLSKPGVGRDRLTAAAGAACRPDPDAVRALLRGR